jgi:hydroxymethylbilane synthase
VVGTSSARRKALIKNLRPDLKVKDLRGNVDTRLRKLEQGEYDAIILAEAGIVRLGIEVPYVRLDWREFPPSPGQGIVVAVARRDSEIASKLKEISDEKAEKEATLERGVLRAFGGGCHVPLGAISFVNGDEVRIRATSLSLDGERRVDVEVIGKYDPTLGELVGKELKCRL